MNEALLMAARATTTLRWEITMNQMKELNVKAWKGLMGVIPACWRISHFKVETQYDLQVNKIFEVLNRLVLDYIDKSIITLLERIKHYITMRIVTQKDVLCRCKDIICPKIQQVLEKTKRTTNKWNPTWNFDDDFAILMVSNDVETYVIIYCRWNVLIRNDKHMI